MKTGNRKYLWAHGTFAQYSTPERTQEIASNGLKIVAI